MANLSESWSLTLSTTDATTTTVLQRTVPNLANTSITSVQYTDFLVLANGANVITLPIANIFGLLIRCLGSAGQSVTVTWTVQGGAPQPAKVLGPNGIIAFLETGTVAATSITSLTLTASAANIPVEIKLLG